MDRLTRLAIEQECAALSHAFGYHLDARDYDAVVALFVEGGLWRRYGVDLRGRDALMAAMRQRPLNQLTRHVVTNLHFIEVGADVCRAVVTIFALFNSDALDIPALLPPDATVVMDFHDTYQNTAAGWRILERDTRPVFLPPALLALAKGKG